MNPQFLIPMPHRENNIGSELNMGEKHNKIKEKKQNMRDDTIRGAMMRGPLIQTEARTILNRGISQGISQGRNKGKKETALRMLKVGKLTVEEIAEYSALSVAEIEQLANLQTV